jgi:hypothetical protein
MPRVWRSSIACFLGVSDTRTSEATGLLLALAELLGQRPHVLGMSSCPAVQARSEFGAEVVGLAIESASAVKPNERVELLRQLLEQSSYRRIQPVLLG